ncbi:MAG: RNA 2',3'-cyclic phosphodiesterase [Pseudomonadota bacterium]
MYRLFVAIDLPEETRQQLATMCYGVPGARWVPEDQLHLSLRFIGEVDGGRGRDIIEELATIQSSPFSLRLKGAGHFPPRQEPRVLWVGVERNDALLQLRNKVEYTLVRLGLAPEGRKFSPHITLARLKGTSVSKVVAFLAYNGLYESSFFEVSEFVLYSSTLSPKGALYNKEESFPLGQPSRFSQ